MDGADLISHLHKGGAVRNGWYILYLTPPPSGVRNGWCRPDLTPPPSGVRNGWCRLDLTPPRRWLEASGT